MLKSTAIEVHLNTLQQLALQTCQNCENRLAV